MIIDLIITPTDSPLESKTKITKYGSRR